MEWTKRIKEVKGIGLTPLVPMPFEIQGRDLCFDTLVVANSIFHPAKLYQPENKVRIQAGKTLMTSGPVKIESGSEYEFTAGKEIILKAGFHAEMGAKFTAMVEPCVQVAQKTLAGYVTQNVVGRDDSGENNSLKPLDSMLQHGEVNLYPNPAYENVILEIFLEKDSRLIVSICSVDGKCDKINEGTLQLPAGINRVQLSLKGLPQGLYLLRVLGDTFMTQKLLFVVKVK